MRYTFSTGMVSVCGVLRDALANVQTQHDVSLPHDRAASLRTAFCHVPNDPCCENPRANTRLPQHLTTDKTISCHR